MSTFSNPLCVPVMHRGRIIPLRRHFSICPTPNNTNKQTNGHTNYQPADQVVNYEVVLADGSVVEANATTNPDLFRVLKGGGNNFGIVTRFDMATFEAKNIWDGNMIVSKDQTDAVIDAFVDFTAALKEKPDSHVLVMWTWLPQASDPFIMLVLTHLDGVENHQSLEKFTAIPGQKTMQVTSLAKKVASFLVPSGKQ